MCEATTITAVVSALAAAGGTAASYVGSRNAQAAQDQAAALENARQRRIQQTQSNLIARQEQEKEKGRKAFAELQPKMDLESTDQVQTQATDTRNQQYQQAVGPLTADPLQGATETAVVDSPAEKPLAVQAAYDAEAGKAKQFSGQQAQARAFLDALADAQRQAGITMSRGAEQIGMYGDFVSGINRPLQAWEVAKNGQAVFNAQSNAAAQQGADAIALGDAISSIGQLGYAYGTRSKSQPNVTSNQKISYRPFV